MLLISASPAQTEAASAQISVTFDLSAQKQKQAVLLWIPYPVSNRYQFITDIQIEGNYSSSAVCTDSTYLNPILYAHWDSKLPKRHLKFNSTPKEKRLENVISQKKKQPGNKLVALYRPNQKWLLKSFY